MKVHTRTAVTQLIVDALSYGPLFFFEQRAL